ncbi:protein kinase [Streptomyces sp. M19]
MEDGRPWIVMELVRGHSLGDRLAEGTLDPREAARIGQAVLGALRAAHEAGVLHRDVKPDNVLLGRDDRVVLTDFGIAQVEGEQGLTETGGFVGSRSTSRPSGCWGSARTRVGPVVAGRGAVRGGGGHVAVPPLAHARHAPGDPVGRAADALAGSGALGTLIMQLLRKEPAARPTAAEVRETLQAVASPPPRRRPCSPSARTGAPRAAATASCRPCCTGTAGRRRSSAARRWCWRRSWCWSSPSPSRARAGCPTAGRSVRSRRSCSPRSGCRRSTRGSSTTTATTTSP